MTWPAGSTPAGSAGLTTARGLSVEQEPAGQPASRQLELVVLTGRPRVAELAQQVLTGTTLIEAETEADERSKSTCESASRDRGDGPDESASVQPPTSSVVRRAGWVMLDRSLCS